MATGGRTISGDHDGRVTEIRCGNCKHWLGEATEPLVYVEHVNRGPDANVSRPRDLRLCKSCNRVNVFISKAALDGRMRTIVD